MVIRIFMQKLKRFFLSRYAWCIVLCGCAVYGTTLGALGYTVGKFSFCPSAVSSAAVSGRFPYM